MGSPPFFIFGGILRVFEPIALVAVEEYGEYE